MASAYGYCPVCGLPGARRERRMNGDDTCQAGHVYPSRTSLREPGAMVSVHATTLGGLSEQLRLLSLNINHGPEEWQGAVKHVLERSQETIARLLGGK